MVTDLQSIWPEEQVTAKGSAFDNLLAVAEQHLDEFERNYKGRPSIVKKQRRDGHPYKQNKRDGIKSQAIKKSNGMSPTHMPNLQDFLEAQQAKQAQSSSKSMYHEERHDLPKKEGEEGKVKSVIALRHLSEATLPQDILAVHRSELSSETDGLPFLPHLIAIAVKRRLVSRASRSPASLLHIPLRIEEIVEATIEIYPQIETAMTRRAIHLAVSLVFAYTTSSLAADLKVQFPSQFKHPFLPPHTVSEALELATNQKALLGGLVLSVQGLNSTSSLAGCWNREMEGKGGEAFRMQIYTWAFSRGPAWRALGVEVVELMKELGSTPLETEES